LTGWFDYLQFNGDPINKFDEAEDILIYKSNELERFGLFSLMGGYFLHATFQLVRDAMKLEESPSSILVAIFVFNVVFSSFFLYRAFRLKKSLKAQIKTSFL